MKSMSVDDKRVWVTEYIQCTTECGLEAGDQSAARLAQLIIGYVGGCVHAEGSARELIILTVMNEARGFIGPPLAHSTETERTDRLSNRGSNYVVI